jgi:glycosyltransferase involved in cell wall biosynthesis
MTLRWSMFLGCNFLSDGNVSRHICESWSCDSPRAVGTSCRLREASWPLRPPSTIEWNFPGVPQRPGLLRWFDRGDVFLNFTHADNSLMSLIEVMALGLPVASTAVGGVTYRIKNRKDGLLVPPRDARAMADVERQLLRNPDLARRWPRRRASRSMPGIGR